MQWFCTWILQALFNQQHSYTLPSTVILMYTFNWYIRRLTSLLETLSMLRAMPYACVGRCNDDKYSDFCWERHEYQQLAPSLPTRARTHTDRYVRTHARARTQTKQIIVPKAGSYFYSAFSCFLELDVLIRLDPMGIGPWDPSNIEPFCPFVIYSFILFNFARKRTSLE